MRINSLSPVNNNYTASVPASAQTTGMDSPVVSAPVVQAVQEPKAMESVEGEYSLQSAEHTMSEELLDKSIQQANKNLVYQNRVIERMVHDVTKAVIYTVRDTVTHEVIAEFPPKRIQDMIAKMWELAGLFVDEKA